MTPFPARIHILLASQAPLGLVIRRGPAKQVATLLWDRRQDTFQLGQWLKGRIYERRCDLSPDGKYLIYFAMNGKWESEAKGSWTAISRAPYLRALTLLPKGDCWHGGGLWTSPTTYWLNGCNGNESLYQAKEVQEDNQYVVQHSQGGECLSVYYPRLHRDGWEMTEQLGASRCERLDVFEKDLVNGWRLQKHAFAGIQSLPGKGCYWDEHRLIHPASGKEINGEQWEWAEWDGDRVMWATAGKLFAGKIGPQGLEQEKELYDFNRMTFEAIAAPY